jgi:hypothetical protein
MINEIVEGWKNYIVKNPLVEAEAKRRAAICSSCECNEDKEHEE